MPTIRDIFDTYRRGDSLEDAELEMLAEQMEAIHRHTADFGDMFGLTSTYAGQVARNCRDYLHNRRVEPVQEARRLSASNATQQPTT